MKAMSQEEQEEIEQFIQQLPPLDELRRQVSPEEIQELLRQCELGTQEEQRQALLVLYRQDQLPTEEVVRVALPLIWSSEYWVARLAVKLLGKVALPEMHHVGQELMALLQRSRDRLRSGEEVHQEEVSSIRYDVVEALGCMRYVPATKLTVQVMLEDPDGLVRVSAAENLGYWEDDSVIPALLQAIMDPYPLVPWYALTSIGFLGNASHLEELYRYKDKCYKEPLEYTAYAIACYRMGDRKKLVVSPLGKET